MAILTLTDYRLETGDGQSGLDEVNAALARAQAEIEEALGRRLEWGSRTETLVVSPTGFVYPVAVPVTEVAASAEAEMFGDDCFQLGNVTAGWFDLVVEPRRVFDDDVYQEVTYSGGFTRDNLPQKLRQAICQVAHRMLHPNDPEGLRVGATQIRVGDVAIGRPATAVATSLDRWIPGLTTSLKDLYLGRL